MKKILSLVLAVLMVAAMLCACGDTTPTTKPNADKPTQTPTQAPTQTQPTTTKPAEPQGPAVVTLADFFSQKDKWEDDGGEFTLSDDQILFDNFYAGDYVAVRMGEEYQDVTYKFNVTITKLAPVSYEEGNWWDSEFCVIARSALAASSWPDDSGSQKGYTLTWWGDMSEVAIGRCGMDDAFGEFDANIGDGQAHDIEFTVINNADGTVSLKLVIDGNVIADVVDDGTKQKNDRPTLYPDAGGLTIRAKWLEAIVK